MTAVGPIGRLGRWSAHHVRATVAIWMVALVGLGLFAPAAEKALSGAGWEATGSESVDVRATVQQEFGGLASSGLMVVLVSDGVPTDSWEGKLDHFIQEGRSAKCDRMALGIGPEAYEGMGRATLERFVAGTEHKVFEAKDAGEIHNFFKFVTMSVVTRGLSQDPNAVPKDAELKPPTPTAATPAEAPVLAEPVASPTPEATTEDEDSYW